MLVSTNGHEYASATRTFTRLASVHFSFTGSERDMSHWAGLRENVDVVLKDDKRRKVVSGACMIVLGIDAGATKTHVVLATMEGEVLSAVTAGSANWEFVGLNGTRDVLVEAITRAAASAKIKTEDIAAGGLGLAGLDWPSDEARLQLVVDSLGTGGPSVLVNDAFLPLRAGTAHGVGVAAIAGTGATVVGRNWSGKRERSFGAGYPFTDWGGAGDLAQAAVHAVASAYMDLGPQTTLAGRMLHSTGCGTVAEMMESIMRWKVVVGGEFAPHVMEAAGEGDESARAIVRRAGESIGRNVLTVARRLDMPGRAFDLVTAGGVFSSRSELLNASLLDTVRTEAVEVNLVHWAWPPVVGALILAMDSLKPERLPDPEVLGTRVGKALRVSEKPPG